MPDLELAVPHIIADDGDSLSLGEGRLASPTEAAAIGSGSLSRSGRLVSPTAGQRSNASPHASPRSNAKSVSMRSAGQSDPFGARECTVTSDPSGPPPRMDLSASTRKSFRLQHGSPSMGSLPPLGRGNRLQRPGSNRQSLAQSFKSGAGPPELPSVVIGPGSPKSPTRTPTKDPKSQSGFFGEPRGQGKGLLPPLGSDKRPSGVLKKKHSFVAGDVSPGSASPQSLGSSLHGSPNRRSFRQGGGAMEIKTASAQLALLAQITRGNKRRDRNQDAAADQAEASSIRRSSTEEADRIRKEKIRQKVARLLFAIATCQRFINMLKPDNKDPVLAERRSERKWMKENGAAAAGAEGGVKPKENERQVSLSRIALPTAADLHNLPIDLQNTFTTLALETLRKYMYPKLLLWNRKQERQRMRDSHNTQRLTLDILRRQDMFKAWPDMILQDVCERAVVECYNKDEFIIHEDEQAGSGIYFVMTGSVQILKKKSRETKAIGGTNALVLVQLNPIICVGEFSFLTEEPRMASIRACTRVDCWVLKKNDFAHFVSQLPHTIFQSVIDVAFAARNKNMHLSYPLTEKILRETPIFRPCPSAMLIELLQGARPYAVPKNMKICKGDHPADKIFFLRNGRCGLMRQIGRGGKIYERRPSETLIGTIKAPMVIGETAVMHGGGYGDSVMTLSTCDFWVLNKLTFDSVVRRHRGVDAMMMAEARAQRQEQLAQQQNLFRECVYEIPLLKEAATRLQLRALVHRFDAHVYKPLSVICSTTRFADRLVILYKGRVRVGAKHQEWHWAKGECAGFTCVIPHRWAQAAVAVDIVECLELPLPSYVEFLKQNKLYSYVVRWVKQLLFPAAFDPEVADAAEDLVGHLRSPPMYPRSTSTKVNLHEEGFGGSHYSHLSYLSEVQKQTESVMSIALSPKRAKIRQGSTILSSAPLTSAGQTESLESGPAKRTPNSWVRMSSFVWRKPLKQYGSTDHLGLCQALRRAGRNRRRAVETSVDPNWARADPNEVWRDLI
eukprot:Hpha_TRINITY_DN15696_c1_g10::TRINITY_DN15696_c1_g10_i1::g.101495::m.101495